MIEPAKSAKKKTTRKSPLSVLLTMGVVGGLFAMAALPAYAVSPVDPLVEASEVDAQTLTVSASAATPGATRDKFKATTEAELQAKREAKLAAELATTFQAGPRAAGDDYPYRGEEGLSPMRYYKGECVDFVAWRLNQDAGASKGNYKWVWSNLTPGGGSANQWESAWKNHGWKVSGKPVVGSVAVTGADHVAYVKDVLSGGKVLVEEYNYAGYHQYGTRILKASTVIAFLYPPG